MVSNYERKQLLSNNFFTNSYPNPNNAFLTIQPIADTKKTMTSAMTDMSLLIQK